MWIPDEVLHALWRSNATFSAQFVLLSTISHSEPKEAIQLPCVSLVLLLVKPFFTIEPCRSKLYLLLCCFQEPFYGRRLYQDLVREWPFIYVGCGNETAGGNSRR